MTDVMDRVTRWKVPTTEGSLGMSMFSYKTSGVLATTVAADVFLLPKCLGTVEIEGGYFVVKNDAVNDGDPNREMARTPIHNDFDAFVAWCRMVDELSGVRYREDET